MDPDDPSDREPTPLKVDVWAQIYLEERPALELARELRPVAELLEVPPDLDSPYATAIRGLLRLGLQTWSAVEGGEVSPYGAATNRNDLADEANAAARADREMMMIVDLARHERVVSEHYGTWRFGRFMWCCLHPPIEPSHRHKACRTVTSRISKAPQRKSMWRFRNRG
jgi:hypothetical protein